MTLLASPASEMGFMAIHWADDNASQESLNAWTHGLGFVLSLPAGFVLTRLALETNRDLVVSCIIYSVSLAAMYLFSTLSHAIRDPNWRHRCRTLDQGFVYTLIAGTFTPFIWSYLAGWPRNLLMAFVWGAAAMGFYSKVFSRHRINNMTSVSYILLGWVPSMVLFGYVSMECFGMMALGGVLYTLGVVFFNKHQTNKKKKPQLAMFVFLASQKHKKPRFYF